MSSNLTPPEEDFEAEAAQILADIYAILPPPPVIHADRVIGLPSIPVVPFSEMAAPTIPPCTIAPAANDLKQVTSIPFPRASDIIDQLGAAPLDLSNEGPRPIEADLRWLGSDITTINVNNIQGDTLNFDRGVGVRLPDDLDNYWDLELHVEENVLPALDYLRRGILLSRARSNPAVNVVQNPQDFDPLAHVEYEDPMLGDDSAITTHQWVPVNIGTPGYMSGYEYSLREARPCLRRYSRVLFVLLNPVVFTAKRFQKLIKGEAVDDVMRHITAFCAPRGIHKFILSRYNHWAFGSFDDCPTAPPPEFPRPGWNIDYTKITISKAISIHSYDPQARYWFYDQIRGRREPSLYYLPAGDPSDHRGVSVMQAAVWWLNQGCVPLPRSEGYDTVAVDAEVEEAVQAEDNPEVEAQELPEPPAPETPVEQPAELAVTMIEPEEDLEEVHGQADPEVQVQEAASSPTAGTDVEHRTEEERPVKRPRLEMLGYLAGLGSTDLGFMPQFAMALEDEAGKADVLSSTAASSAGPSGSSHVARKKRSFTEMDDKGATSQHVRPAEGATTAASTAGSANLGEPACVIRTHIRRPPTPLSRASSRASLRTASSTAARLHLPAQRPGAGKTRGAASLARNALAASAEVTRVGSSRSAQLAPAIAEASSAGNGDEEEASGATRPNLRRTKLRDVKTLASTSTTTTRAPANLRVSKLLINTSKKRQRDDDDGGKQPDVTSTKRARVEAPPPVPERPPTALRPTVKRRRDDSKEDDHVEVGEEQGCEPVRKRARAGKQAEVEQEQMNPKASARKDLNRSIPRSPIQTRSKKSGGQVTSAVVSARRDHDAPAVDPKEEKPKKGKTGRNEVGLVRDQHVTRSRGSGKLFRGPLPPRI